ncbi:hypothetical protein ON010_g4002 [Phytophthora cinnamomi]|nr:hypothetical protein ON010_g4002 [Phytophthora cinnamomi]
MFAWTLYKPYEEGSNLTEFFLKLKNAMKAAQEAADTVIAESQMSIYLFQSMPKSWKNDLCIWKGQRKYIPYEVLKQSIEGKVRDIQAQERSKVTPETSPTKNERALVATGLPALQDQVCKGNNSCSYCDRPRLNIRQCRELEKGLRDGRNQSRVRNNSDNNGNGGNGRRVKNYDSRKHKHDGSGGKNRHPDQGKNRPPDSDSDDSDDDGAKRNVFRQQRCDNSLIAVATTINPPISLTAQANVQLDPTGTVDSGCTRHVTHESQWFADIATSGGSITRSVRSAVALQPALNALMATNTDLYQFRAQPKTTATALMAKGKQRFLLLLHKRLGHPNACILHDLSWNQSINGLDDAAPVDSTAQFFCVACRRDVHVLQHTRNLIEDHDIQRLQAANAKEYEMLGRMIFKKYGTHAQFTNACTPQQNGVAERRVRTIMERVRSRLLDGKLPKQLWAECVCHVTTPINMTPSSKTDGRTPYELWYRRIPSMAYMNGTDQLVNITDPTPAIVPPADFPPVPTPGADLAPAITPPAGPDTSTAAVPHRLPSLREALDRNEMHYSFRAEAKSDSSSPPASKRPRLTNDDEEVTLNSKEDQQEQEQRRQLLYTLLAIR